ncbi:hypothetical protein CSB37_02870 [bacterium DOLZORAL124_38_8]|nr:MAG: hypothetical protein CSB37_02870 [bacterium DOLZORAL124_38_8]
MNNFLISQILATGAFISDMLSFQQKTRKNILILLSISSGLIALHYFFLNKFLAGLLVFISLVRYITACYTKSNKALFLFLGINIISGIYLYSHSTDIITILALVFITVGSFQKNDQYLRLIMMPGTALFILYNYLIWSPVAVLLESALLTSNIVGYLRHYRLQKKS